MDTIYTLPKTYTTPSYPLVSPPSITSPTVFVPSKIPPSVTTTGTGLSLFIPYTNEISGNFVTINASTINTSTINATVGTISSFNSRYITASDISTNSINLDGNILTTDSGAGGELLLNGIPIATTENISSITDWSLYPAISTINMNNHNIIGGADFQISTINGQPIPTDIYISSSVASWSLYKASSDVNLNNDNLNNVNQLNLTTGGNVTMLTAGAGNTLLVNGTPVSGGTAVSTITGSTTYDIADAGANVSGASLANITAQNGLYGKVNITANPGYGGVSGGNVSLTANGGSGLLGLNGAINITANPGSSSTAGVTSGGSINIVANSGVSDGANLTSKVTINGAGVNSIAGYTSPVASVAGYNFIGGNLGVNICAGFQSLVPNVPGTMYLYALNGIEAVSPVYTTNLYPYWDGNVAPANLTIQGRTTIIGQAFVEIDNVDTLSFDGNGSKAITGLSTINGVPWNSGGGSATEITNAGATVSCDALSTITASTEGYDITLTNTQTSLVVGLTTDTPPSTGLFINPTNITFNGASLIPTAPPPQSLVINEQTIPGGDTIEYNLQGSDIGTYFILETDNLAGTYIIDFQVPLGAGFNAGSTFWIKNLDPNGNAITITFDGGNPGGNPILYPFSLSQNASIAVCYWDGTTFSVF